MDSVLIISIIYFVGIVILLIANELYYRYLGVKGEYSRKFAHITATLATLPFPYIIPSHWYILVLALIFFVVLYITQRSTFLNSIHDIRRRSIGSYLLPVAIYITFLISSLFGSKILFILPMLILAICDPVAAIVGMSVKKFNRNIRLGRYTLQKTWLGSAGFLVSSFILTIIALYIHFGVLNLKTIYISLMIGVAGTIAELASWRGSDNITIPLSVQFILIFLLFNQAEYLPAP